MEGRRLLERVRNWKEKPVISVSQDYSQKVESVILHLQKLLNSKQGTTLMDEFYGMPDFTDLTVMFPDSVREIESAISKTIEKYEPRLSEVKVIFVLQNELSLSLLFQIQAIMKTEDNDMSIYLESSIDNNGKMKIKG